MLFYFNHFFQTWLLPPGSILLLAFLGCMLWRYRPFLAKSLIIVSLCSLWLLSTPVVAQYLTDRLQFQYPALSPEKLKKSSSTSAIVVLEAGLNLQTPEYEDHVVAEHTLTRILYAAFLNQKIGAPILLSGNDPNHLSLKQTDYMANDLYRYSHIKAKWKEDKGYNTDKEALYASDILKKSGVTTIYLVTHAYHMPRAMYAFQHHGLDIIPAPTGFIIIDYHLGGISSILPTIDSLQYSTAALREYVGIAWYKVITRMRA